MFLTLSKGASAIEQRQIEGETGRLPTPATHVEIVDAVEYRSCVRVCSLFFEVVEVSPFSLGADFIWVRGDGLEGVLPRRSSTKHHGASFVVAITSLPSNVHAVND